MKDHFDLQEYLNSIPAKQREAVFAAIMSADILKAAFETPQGKAILNEAVNVVNDSVGKIVALAISGFDDNAKAIKQACMEIKIAEAMMRRWGGIIQQGEDIKR